MNRGIVGSVFALVNLLAFGALAVWSSACKASSVVISGNVAVLAPQFASVSMNTEPQNGGIQANRNGQVFTSFESNGATVNSILAAGAGINSRYILTVPNYQTISDFNVSNYGIVAGVYSPGTNGLYGDITEVAPVGQGFQMIKSPDADQSNPTISDNGSVAWAARQSFQTGLNQIWVWKPGQSVMQVPNPSSNSWLYSTPEFDSNGVLSEFYHDETSVPYTDYVGHLANAASGGTTWTRYLLSPDQYSTSQGKINLLGESLYSADNELAISTPASSHGVISFTNSLGQPRQGYSALADDGSVLAVMYGTQTSNPADAVANCYLIRPDGSELNLSALLPAGQTQAAQPLYQMNYNGDVLLEGIDGAGDYDYSVYHDGIVTPLVSLAARPLSPTLTDDDQLYYFTSDGSYYSLNVASLPVPEPTAMGFCVVLISLELTRRRTGRRNRGSRPLTECLAD